MKLVSNHYLVFLAALALICLAAGIATAATVTPGITYQGKLTNAAGSPLTGTFSVTFKLYDASTGGTTLSTDTHSVTATNGLFTTSVAVTNPAIVDGRALWLGIKVGSDPEMTPRHEIRPVPYALSLRPGTIISGDIPGDPVVHLINTGTGSSGLMGQATGAASAGVAGIAQGIFSNGLYGESARDAGIYAVGREGGYFTTNSAGTSWNDVRPGVNVSTSFNYNPGIRINTSGFRSYGVETETTGSGSYGISVYTTGDNSDGVRALTIGPGSNGYKAVTYGKGSKGLDAVTIGDDSPGVSAYTTGAKSPAISGNSSTDTGVYGIGKEGGYFTTNSAGTGWNDMRPGVNVSTSNNYNPGIRITTNGFHSNGVSATTTVDYSHGVNAYTTGIDSMGVFAYTTGLGGHGVYASAKGPTSRGLVGISQQSEGIYGEAISAAGVHGLSNTKSGVYGESYQDVGVYGIGKTGGYFTTNQAGVAGTAVNVSTEYHLNPGLEITTKGSQSPGARINTTGFISGGVFVETGGYESLGLRVLTGGEGSDGVYVVTSGPGSAGISAATRGPGSIGLAASTYNHSSTGIYTSTDGDNSVGMRAFTTGMSSDGVNVVTWGKNSRGISAYSNQSEGVVGKANSAAGVKGESTNKAGVWGVSTNDVGLYAVTDRADDKYGVFTPDYLYAKGTQVPSSDVAEYMPVAGEAAPGTVLVIGKGGVLSPSSTAYDTRVAGIVSTEPGVSLGTKVEGNAGEALIAVAGRVPCRVDASHGAISEGDLLTTSDTPGHAMKAEPVTINGIELHRPGTVIGKAMGALESGTGTIEVLVTLQ